MQEPMQKFEKVPKKPVFWKKFNVYRYETCRVEKIRLFFNIRPLYWKKVATFECQTFHDKSPTFLCVWNTENTTKTTFFTFYASKKLQIHTACIDEYFTKKSGML